jgi:hypothetical protein
VRSTSAPELSEVPWPWRERPEVKSRDTEPYKSVVATNLSKPSFDFYGGAVLIGAADLPSSYVDPKNPRVFTRTDEDPTHFVFSKNYESLFPLAMYRCQVTNANYRRVSGDILQVSPLMENIAYSVTTSGGVTNNTLLDPFVLYEPVPRGEDWTLNLYLLDTQPVIRGARYRYFLVHFGPDWEMEYILPTNEMEVP